ncbi:MAG: WG repeat-containing protein [Eubacterium sp.]|nr:WG repeat-containing protein [Eubacterium sp.]
MKRIISAILIISMIIAGWKYMFINSQEKTDSYDRGYMLAQDYEKKGYYKDAVNEYKKLSQIKNSIEIKRAIVMDYYAMEDWNNFETEAKGFLTSNDDVEIYSMLISLYMQAERLSEAKDYIEKAENLFPENQEIISFNNELKGIYSITYLDYKDISENMDGYSVATKAESIASPIVNERSISILLDKNGSVQLPGMNFNQIYDILGDDEERRLSSEDKNSAVIRFTGTNDADKTVSLDIDGQIRAMSTYDLTYSGVFHDGKALVMKDGKWGYLSTQDNSDSWIGECLNNEDSSEKILSKLKYDDATAFMNGVAAVNEGGKWAFIDKDEKYITDYIFDDVIMDITKCCSRGKAIFARKSGEKKYSMYSLMGEEIINAEYDLVKGFLCTDGLAAVCSGGKWGLIDSEGNAVVNCEYEETGSSASEYIPFKKTGKWGYMDVSGNVLIDPQFDEVRSVSSNGIGYIREEDNWSQISIYYLHGEEGLF